MLHNWSLNFCDYGNCRLGKECLSSLSCNSDCIRFTMTNKAHSICNSPPTDVWPCHGIPAFNWHYGDICSPVATSSVPPSASLQTTQHHTYAFIIRLHCQQKLQMFHGLCVCVLDMITKTAELIETLYAVWTRVGPRNHALGRFTILDHLLPVHARTHARTHVRLTALFPGLPGSASTRKVKTNLDFTEATDSEWQWYQLGHMQVCTSLQTIDSFK